MSTAHLAIGSVAVLAAAQGLLSLVLPDVSPIEVHSLKYANGIMTQSRTVSADGEFFPAEWRAEIHDADTNKPVEGCAGSGFWNYQTGHLDAEMTLMRWTGSDTCTPEYLRSIGGRFYPVASWHWGNDGTSKKGGTFAP
ncbi:hypothetical protein JQV19_08350 [Sulfitobacter mediterraneus]|uniref:hypothetical protein n=1 Tax=Sulfitobacter mediterraneus TaxID=83219 RepID=UPI001939D8BA|nr:hypothetical protein [Sulfitobacter mediterraneus]MBM1556656.1 hypothetical protein [Sulfitobacter mediterraneus]MBM1570148.1 hypothetical protein [Sulfitobacter mediterraneus]MBM1574104.1 hypothetical protein [Sulfitobacter mediterraneus]MBM1577890.1 hypothetical protein [Sulfitobacter mediterraneus]MBM1579614.1 hypothetical protein [Sulfitobacter mediterraneus]